MVKIALDDQNLIIMHYVDSIPVFGMNCMNHSRMKTSSLKWLSLNYTSAVMQFLRFHTEP